MRNVAACTAIGAGDGLGWAAFVVTLPALMTFQFRMIAQIATAYGYDMNRPEEKMNSWLIMQLADTYGGQRIKMLEDMMLNSSLFAGVNISIAVEKIAQQTVIEAVRKNLEAVIKKMVSDMIARKTAGYSQAIVTGATLGGFVGKFFDGGIISGPLSSLISSQAESIVGYFAKKAVRSFSDKLLSRKAIAALPGIGSILGAGFNYWYTNRNAEAAIQYYRLRYIHDHCIQDFRKFKIRDLETILTDLCVVEEVASTKEIELYKEII